MGFRGIKGFTFVEALVVFTLVAVLSVAGAQLMFYFVESSIFIPNQLNTDMVVSDALDLMINGDGKAKGLRFSRSLITIGANEVVFYNQNSEEIRYRLDTDTNQLYRSIWDEGEETVPYYANDNVAVLGKNNQLFTYYDHKGNVTSDIENVRRIQISMIAQIGTGSHADWGAESDQVTSVAVRRFQ